MSSIKLGSSSISNAKLGSTQVSQIYKGSNLIWSNATTTTTTTSGPSLVSGYKVYFDFGNSSSYPGSGTTITNLGSGGSGMNGTISGGTYYPLQHGGVMDLFHSSRDKITFSTDLTAAFTTQAFVRHIGSGTAWGGNSSYYGGWPNIRTDNGFILTNDVGNGTLVLGIIWNGSSANVPSDNFIYPTDISAFHSYAYTSNGTNEHKMYLDTNSPATSTASYSRSNSATVTSYINYDAPNNGSEDLTVMAYLQYDRVLTSSEIAQNYAFFSSRF